jgi:hypothetical protein
VNRLSRAQRLQRLRWWTLAGIYALGAPLGPAAAGLEYTDRGLTPTTVLLAALSCQAAATCIAGIILGTRLGLGWPTPVPAAQPALVAAAAAQLPRRPGSAQPDRP